MNGHKLFAEQPAYNLVVAFWHARAQWLRWRDHYQGCVEAAKQSAAMLAAVDGLLALGLFPEGSHRPMPTVDEVDLARRHR